MSLQRGKHGFTLVELLAVIVVVGIIVALLLPALASSAADANRDACENKLRQLGLAVVNYETGKKRFPTVQFNMSPAAAPPKDCRPADSSGGKSTTGYSWLVQILPQLEESNFYRNLSNKSNRFAIQNGPFDPSLVTSAPGSTQHVSCVPLLTAICPDWAGNEYTHKKVTIDAGRAANPEEPADQGAPEYASVDAATPGTGDESFKGRVAPTCYKPMVGTHMVNGMPVENGGMALGTQGLTFEAFGDGTSPTILLCESKECGYASWYDGTLNWLVGNDPNQPAPGADDKPPWTNAALSLNKGFDPKVANSVPYLKKDSTSNKPQNDIRWGPSSDHAHGVVYHLFVDLHTRGITDACDADTYLALITRDGGETIDDTKIK